MKDFNLPELFCEILTGLSIVLLIVPILDIIEVISIHEFVKNAKNHISITDLMVLAFVSYLLGIIVDGLCLAIGEYKFDDLICSEKPTDHEKKVFWSQVELHVLSYRDRQWAFYTCYRNIFIVFIPCSLLWTASLALSYGTIVALIALTLFILIEIGLILSMKVLLPLYYLITKSYTIEEAPNAVCQDS